MPHGVQGAGTGRGTRGVGRGDGTRDTGCGAWGRDAGDGVYRAWGWDPQPRFPEQARCCREGAVQRETHKPSQPPRPGFSNPAGREGRHTCGLGLGPSLHGTVLVVNGLAGQGEDPDLGHLHGGLLDAAAEAQDLAALGRVLHHLGAGQGRAGR